MKKLSVFYYHHSANFIELIKDMSSPKYLGKIYFLTHTVLKKQGWNRVLANLNVVNNLTGEELIQEDDLLFIDDIDLFLAFRNEFKTDLYLNVLKGFDLFSNIIVFINLANENRLSIENKKLLIELLEDSRFSLQSFKLNTKYDMQKRKIIKIYPFISYTLIKNYLKTLGDSGIFFGKKILPKISLGDEKTWVIVDEAYLDLIIPRYFDSLNIYSTVVVISKFRLNFNVLLGTFILWTKMVMTVLCFAENE